MLSRLIVPESTPARKVKGYKMPENRERLLSWHFVVEQMSESRHCWIGTVYPERRPHVVPVWGIWFDNRVHLEGSMDTAWGKNILGNPQLAVHLPSANKVVTIEGAAHIIQEDVSR
jgi:hypothetical protein